MMKLVVFILISLSVANSQNLFGYFYVETESVSLPEPQNDVAHYHLQVKKTGKDKKRIDARFEFLRRVEDLKVSLALYKKKISQADDYNLAYKRSTPTSLCSTTEKKFPVLKKSFTGKLNEKDCSVDKGEYQFVNYSVDAELRSYVGNKTFYGSYKGRFFITEGSTKKDIMVFDLAFTVKPDLSSKANAKQKTNNKPNPK